MKERCVEHINCLKLLLSELDVDQVSDIIQIFLFTRDRDGTIFFAGNGGSASTASHFAQDLREVGRKSNSPLFRTVCLNNDIALMTALANDYGYEYVFSLQLADICKRNDVLVVISASGNSINIIKAVEMASSIGCSTIALVGFDGGKLKQMCDYVLQVSTPQGKYGLVEDMHLAINHMIFSSLIDHIKNFNEKDIN